MEKRKLLLTFSEETAKEPVIHNLSRQFNIVTNIHRADLREDRGWMELEIDGEHDEVEKAIVWITSKGVRVETGRDWYTDL